VSVLPGAPLSVAENLAFDPAGNLYVTDAGFATPLYVLPRSTGTIFGAPVTADELAAVPNAENVDFTFDPSGDLFGFSNLALTGDPLNGLVP